MSSERSFEKLRKDISSYFEGTKLKLMETLKDSVKVKLPTPNREQEDIYSTSHPLISMDVPIKALEYSLDLLDQQISMKFNLVDEKLQNQMKLNHELEEKLTQVPEYFESKDAKLLSYEIQLKQQPSTRTHEAKGCLS